MRNADVTKVARYMNLDERRIQQLVKEGMPRVKHGQYNLDACAQWYIRYLQSALEKKSVPLPDGSYTVERDERIRNLRADAELKEMELAKERGLLVSLQDVESTMTDLILTTKARVLAIPPRVAPELVGEMSRVMIQAKIEKACKEALASLAKAANESAAAPPDSATVPSADTPERKG